MQGMESPAKMKLAVSGCPRNCAESYVKDVGIVAMKGARCEIYIGGAAGAHVRKGDLLARSMMPRPPRSSPGGFFSTTGRTPSGWSDVRVRAAGRLDHIKAVVVDDSEGIAERLDAAVREHADGYVAHGPAGGRPVTPGQSARRCRSRCCRGPIAPSSCSAVPGERRDERATHRPL